LASRSASVVSSPLRARPKPGRAPRRRPRPRAAPGARTAARARSRARSRAGIGLILLGGVLLAGVVFVNLAVLRLNLRLDAVTAERAKLRAANAALQSQLSAALASGKIQALAHRREGLVEADPSTIRYIDLGSR